MSTSTRPLKHQDFTGLQPRKIGFRTHALLDATRVVAFVITAVPMKPERSPPGDSRKILHWQCNIELPPDEDGQDRSIRVEVVKRSEGN